MKKSKTEANPLESREEKIFALNKIVRAFSTYLSLSVLISLGKVKDFFRYFAKNNQGDEKYPLLIGCEHFFIRHVFNPVSDCWNIPILSCPGTTVQIADKYCKDSNGNPKIRDCINMGSYNYLGFASKESPTLGSVYKALENFSVSPSIYRGALTTTLHRRLEEKLAEMTHKEAAAIFSMGFGCNSTFIPFVVGKGDLVFSDEKNHSSIVQGCFASNASVKVFPHNNTEVLERMVREAIFTGQTRVKRPWRKIFIFIEGLYSMEGYYPKLREIVAIKKKYNCYLFLDEAHSFGGVGRTGKGVSEKLGVDPTDIDIQMGTFTKSYGAFGGFIATKKALVDEIRDRCPGYLQSFSIPPPVCQQILSAMDFMNTGSQGKQRAERLRLNSNYFRHELKDLGFNILGDEDSPVIVLILGTISHMAAFSRECRKRNVAIVVAGFPATQLTGSRARFCISAGHTREQLDKIISVISHIGDLIHCKFSKRLGG